jgi:hypothetical protein
MIDNPASPFAKSMEMESKSADGESLSLKVRIRSEQMEQLRKGLPKIFFKKSKHGPSKDVDTTAKRRFALASISDEYDAAYRLLSCRLLSWHTHGMIAAILDGVVKGHGLEWPPAEPKPTVLGVDIMSSLLISASKRLGKKYGKPITSFLTLERQLRALQGTTG